MIAATTAALVALRRETIRSLLQQCRSVDVGKHVFDVIASERGLDVALRNGSLRELVISRLRTLKRAITNHFDRSCQASNCFTVRHSLFD